MANANVVEVTDTNFESEVLKSNVPVLLDFWADWCAPCRAIAPHVHAIADDYVGKVRVGKCDIDTNPKVSAQFGIMSIPTLLLFKGGEVIGQLVGAASRPKVEELVKKAL